jgi:formyltetrahydrofolate deformylase
MTVIQTLGKNTRKAFHTTAVAFVSSSSSCSDADAGSESRSATPQNLGTLRVFGPDGNGLVAACSDVLGRHGANIIRSEHWTDTQHDLYFQRLAFVYNPNQINKLACQQELDDRLVLSSSLRPDGRHDQQQWLSTTKTTTARPTLDGPSVSSSSSMESIWNWRDRRKRVGIMVSKYDHCLWELLLRNSAHELDMDIAVVISNHETLRPVADTFQIPYHRIGPITPKTKAEQEAIQIEMLQRHDVDVVVLARYMQVLSPTFLQKFPHSIINIHHSFLPAFVGGSPYHQAYDRGVKLIGATAHYATADLDDGPIIEQDVIPVSHRDGVKELMRKGRILERNVLLKALEAHMDDRIIVHDNRCIVFGD